MNKERRNKIYNIVTDIERIKSDLESILFDEQMAFDNMPENLQYSMRGEESQEAIENMEGAGDSMQTAVDALEEAVEKLEEIG